MSGAKRRTKYRKQVEDDVLYGTPEPGENQTIVVMVESRGGNLLEVMSTEGKTSLCRLPTKFRKLIWVKRGTYMIVTMQAEEERTFETASGEKGKVVYTVEHVLFKDQIKHLKQKDFGLRRLRMPRRRRSRRVEASRRMVAATILDFL